MEISETRGPEISGQNCGQQYIKHDFVNLQCVLNAVIAQLVEHKIANLRVPSSTLGRRCDLSTAITLGKLDQPETTQLFFFFLWQNGRPNDIPRHPRHPRHRRRLSLSLFFFSFSFRDAEVLWARLRVVCWSVRRIWKKKRDDTSLFIFFYFFFSRPPSPQSRPGLLTPPPRFVVSSHFASASASAFAFPSPSSSSRSPCLSSSLSTNRLRLNLRLSLYPRARPTKHLLVMF